MSDKPLAEMTKEELLAHAEQADKAERERIVKRLARRNWRLHERIAFGESVIAKLGGEQ